MAVREPIFTNFTFVGKHFVNNSYTEFHENPLNGLVADTVPRTGGRTDGRTCCALKALQTFRTMVEHSKRRLFSIVREVTSKGTFILVNNAVGNLNFALSVL
jgi:hypothetical protein